MNVKNHNIHLIHLLCGAEMTYRVLHASHTKGFLAHLDKTQEGMSNNQVWSNNRSLVNIITAYFCYNPTS